MNRILIVVCLVEEFSAGIRLTLFLSWDWYWGSLWTCFGLKVILRLLGRGDAVTCAFLPNPPLPASVFLELYGQYTSPKNSLQTEICHRKTEDKQRKLKFTSEVYTDTQHLSHPSKHLCNVWYPSGGARCALQIISAQTSTTVLLDAAAPRQAVKRWNKLSILLVSITTVKVFNPSPCPAVYSIIET